MDIIIKISEYKIATGPTTLITRALGSCVAVCLYERQKKLGGLCHFILPDSSISHDRVFRPAKFADTGIKSMLNGILKSGGKQSAIVAKIVGGAKMFAALGDSLNIGDKNTKAAEEILAELKIPIIARDTGADYGRNVKMMLDSGIVEVTSFQKGTNQL